MIDLLHLLKDLEVPAIESSIFIIRFDENSDCISNYQTELELEINGKESV